MKTIFCNLLILCCLNNILFAQSNMSTDWTYNSQKNTIITKPTSLTIKEGVLINVQFSENHLQYLQYFTSDSETGVYAKLFSINNTLFTGELHGLYSDGNTAFRVLFKKGKRYGDFLVTLKNGKKINKSFEPEGKFSGTFPSVTLRAKKEVEPRPNNSRPLAKKKPVIYLYPTEKQDISVKVDFLGKLTHTYPKYNPQTGWNVVATPSGTLLDKSTNLEYYALFWEGENKHRYDLSTGFVVKGEETAQFLDNTLKILGLNRREANEFIMFWLPQMENNAYNLIHFSQEEYTNLAKLDIQPKPETIIRVMMVFQPQENFVQITPQKLPATPIRTGFTVVEWGGMEQPKLEK